MEVGMRRNFFWQAALLVIAILLALNFPGPWLFTPIPSHGAKSTEYKVVPVPEIPRNMLKSDPLHTPPSQLIAEKVKAASEILQETLNQLAKDGWEFVTLDTMNGLLILKK